MGGLLATPNALGQVLHADIQAALNRHLSGDWGDVDPEDRAANDTALIEGSRLFSAYHGRNGVKFWIVTEAARQSTTILLPEDY